MKIAFEGYLNGSDENEYPVMEDLEEKYGFKMSKDAMRNAAGWGYEVSFQLMLDTETGDVEIVGCDGFQIDKTKKLKEMKS